MCCVLVVMSLEYGVEVVVRGELSPKREVEMEVRETELRWSRGGKVIQLERHCRRL